MIMPPTGAMNACVRAASRLCGGDSVLVVKHGYNGAVYSLAFDSDHSNILFLQ